MKKVYELDKYPTKLLGLGSNFIISPKNFKMYLRDNIFHKRSPLDLGLPWISYNAIEEVKSHLTKTSKVLEFGSGGSTIFFSGLVSQVVSVENNSDWINFLISEIKNKSIDNVELISCSYDHRSTGSFYNSDYAQKVLDDYYDTILIDCKEVSNYEARPYCFKLSEHSVKQNGIIILDDSWRYPQVKMFNKAKYYKEFMGIGPGRKGLTETTIFYY